MFVHLPSLRLLQEVDDVADENVSVSSPLTSSHRPVRGKVGVYHKYNYYSLPGMYMYPQQCLFAGAAFSQTLSYDGIIDQRGPVCAASAVSNLVNAFSRTYLYQQRLQGFPIPPETAKFPEICRNSSRLFHENNLCTCAQDNDDNIGYCPHCMLYTPNTPIPLALSTSDVLNVYRGMILEQLTPMYKTAATKLIDAMLSFPHGDLVYSNNTILSTLMNKVPVPTNRTDFIVYVANSCRDLRIESCLHLIFPLMFLQSCNNCKDVELQIRCRQAHLFLQLIHLKLHNTSNLECTRCDSLKAWTSVDVDTKYNIPVHLLQRISVPLLVLLLLVFQVNVDFLFYTELDESALVDTLLFTLPYTSKDLIIAKQAVLYLVGNNNRRQQGYKKLSLNEFEPRRVCGITKPQRASTGVIGNWALLKVCRALQFGGWILRDGYSPSSSAHTGVSPALSICPRVCTDVPLNSLHPGIHSSIQCFVMFKGNAKPGIPYSLVDSPHDKVRVQEMLAESQQFHVRVLLEELVQSWEDQARNTNDKMLYCQTWQLRRDLLSLLRDSVDEQTDDRSSSSLASWYYPWLFSPDCVCRDSVVCTCRKKNDEYWDFVERSDSICIPKGLCDDIEENNDHYIVSESSLLPQLWALLSHFVTRPNTVLQQHGKNHYSQIYGVREVFVTKSVPKTTRENVDAYKKLDDGEDEGVDVNSDVPMCGDDESYPVEASLQHEGDILEDYNSLYLDCENDTDHGEEPVVEEEEQQGMADASPAVQPKKDKISTKLKKRLAAGKGTEPEVVSTAHAQQHVRKQVHVALRGQYPRWWVDLSELAAVIANSASSYCVIAYICADIQNTQDAPASIIPTTSDEDPNADFWSKAKLAYAPYLTGIPLHTIHQSQLPEYLATIPSMLTHLVANTPFCIPRNYGRTDRNSIAQQYITGYIQALLHVESKNTEALP